MEIGTSEIMSLVLGVLVMHVMFSLARHWFGKGGAIIVAIFGTTLIGIGIYLL